MPGRAREVLRASAARSRRGSRQRRAARAEGVVEVAEGVQLRHDVGVRGGEVERLQGRRLGRLGLTALRPVAGPLAPRDGTGLVRQTVQQVPARTGTVLPGLRHLLPVARLRAPGGGVASEQRPGLVKNLAPRPSAKASSSSPRTSSSPTKGRAHSSAQASAANSAPSQIRRSSSRSAATTPSVRRRPAATRDSIGYGGSGRGGRRSLDSGTGAGPIGDVRVSPPASTCTATGCRRRLGWWQQNMSPSPGCGQCR
jgi:hypothetical protein